MPRELFHRASEALLSVPQAPSGAAPSYTSYADLAGFESALIQVAVGACSASSLIMKLQESDTTTSGDFTDVAVADLLLPTGVSTNALGVVTGDANTVKGYAYIGTKRYIRLQTTSGTMTGGIAVVVTRGHPRYSVTR